MYDQFEPFKKISQGLNFQFMPERYEIWQNGRCFEDKISIVFNIKQDEEGKVHVQISENGLNIKSVVIFDMAYTSGNRIYCATVPIDTNINNSDAFLSFKRNVPLGFNITTRKSKFFDENEPYVFSVFLMQNKLVKVSFSFENNPRIVEFYAKGIRE